MIPVTSLSYGILAAITGAFGGLYLKKGAERFHILRPFQRNIILGCFLYFIAVGFFVLGLQYVPLSFFYPFSSLMHIFASILGFTVLKERVTSSKIIGICLIVLGIVLSALGR